MNQTNLAPGLLLVGVVLVGCGRSKPTRPDKPIVANVVLEVANMT